MADKEEWGPWIEHDGKGCPADGAWVHVEMLDGELDEASADDFCWEYANLDGFFPGFIVRFRIRKPRGLTILEDIAREVERETEDAR